MSFNGHIHTSLGFDGHEMSWNRGCFSGAESGISTVSLSFAGRDDNGASGGEWGHGAGPGGWDGVIGMGDGDARDGTSTSDLKGSGHA